MNKVFKNFKKHRNKPKEESNHTNRAQVFLYYGILQELHLYPKFKFNKRLILCGK